jgi:hypothetical protein
MTEIPVTSYTFNPTAGTITFTEMTVVDPNRVAAIYDQSLPTEGQEFGTVLYLADDQLSAVATGNVLTIPKDRIPPQATTADSLKISYNIDPPEDVQLLRVANVAALPGTGASGYLYLAEATGQLYEWNGTAFVAV